MRAALLQTIGVRGAVLVLSTALLVAGCDLLGSDSGGGSDVSLSFLASSERGTSAKTSQVTITDSLGNSVTIDDVKLVIRGVELEASEAAECENGDDGCAEAGRGPFLADPALQGSDPAPTAQLEVPSGSWEEIEFTIEGLDPDSEADADLRNETGFPEQVAIQVTGSWTPADSSSRSFTYRSSDFDEDMELELNPPLEVEAGTTSNLTVELRLGSWFRKDDGSLFDPAAANEGGSYDDEAEDNIDDAFDAFEDANEDGDPDADED